MPTSLRPLRGRSAGSAARPATEALEDALARRSAANQPAFSEGLFRCADDLAAEGKTKEALAICEKLTRPTCPLRSATSAAEKPAS